MVEYAQFYHGEDNRLKLTGGIEEGITEDEHGPATGAAYLIITNRKVAGLNSPLEPGSVGRIDRLGKGDSATEDLAIRPGYAKAIVVRI